MNIQRYSLALKDGTAYIAPDPDGEFVLAKDALKWMEEKVREGKDTELDPLDEE